MPDNVGELLTQRGSQWGDAIGTHVRIAKVWDAIANREEITALKVALMMDGLKSIRADINPDEVDSFDDKGGYTEIARSIAGHPSKLDETATEPSDFVKVALEAVHLVVDSAEQEELPAPLLYGCDSCDGTTIPGATFCLNTCVKQREVNQS